ncbi:hypothetical protein PIB30_036116 [Stylosanthes scabra]|uniref:Uncharacterized protein n=1 Tax=Stylosanthes scabra TaxID=79078 RepID=A0ABU6VEI7_9FABA|nr:hypothetical protein [Stylosanthes scabra]
MEDLSMFQRPRTVALEYEKPETYGTVLTYPLYRLVECGSAGYPLLFSQPKLSLALTRWENDPSPILGIFELVASSCDNSSFDEPRPSSRHNLFGFSYNDIKTCFQKIRQSRINLVATSRAGGSSRVELATRSERVG